MFGKLLKRIFTVPRQYFSSTLSNKLQATDMLQQRHIGPKQSEAEQMLKILGAKSINELIQQAIPNKIRDPNCLQDNAISAALSESQFLAKMRLIASKNKINKCYLGNGYYPTIVPSVIQRNLLQNPGWYTAYTPYQAQVSQGRLESLINYQTMIQELTRLDFSNASLLDQASAGGEALYMCYNIHDGKRKKLFLDRNVFLPTKAVVKTKADYLNMEIIEDSYTNFLANYKPQEFFGIIVQTPDSKGIVHDLTDFFNKIDQKKSNIVKVVASDLLALTLTKAPGDMGADICFGSAQRFGVPMGYGGPYSGFFATKELNVRKMPGRIIGRSIDADGKLAYRMALQTREQHIRREKATSNICTAQALLANIAAMYAIYHGPVGLKKIAQRTNTAALVISRMFEYYGFTLYKPNNNQAQFFDTFTVLDVEAQRIKDFFKSFNIDIRQVSDTEISLSTSQVTTTKDVIEIGYVLSKYVGKPEAALQTFEKDIPQFHPKLARTDQFMKQKVFNVIQSESQMMRFLRFLQEKDISLNRSMISLGSCTLKLNAASEMMPLTWPELNLHPFTPKSNAFGYLEIIQELRSYLKSITGFDEISFQPNSGASGQYAGLLTIAKYHRDRGQGHRNICLIPKTAHGTNPASAILAGMKVIVVDVIEGIVDMNDFRAKADKYSKDLSAFMITFPSTAGKYEDTIHEMCATIHKHGGQVYMDGANMNAQVGYTSPGFLGADVCHLNLHKTFAIPHGGGGPGMGPIGVKKHLIPHLPSHPYSHTAREKSLGTLTHSEYGSASILTISYGYIQMLGKTGVRKATAFAILNANYLMKKLQPYYKISYINGNDRCSHEFILDINPLKKKTGVSEEDIAKRLIDYGFHAPTMSFPIAGTLMVQPTESQEKSELDRFADAMIKIHDEMHNCPEIVKNAPYTAEYLLQKEWPHKFSRDQAAYPLEWVKARGKYWPPVRRVSNPYGDRNLICSCPDISSYLE